jgi:hypothetical protein
MSRGSDSFSEESGLVRLFKKRQKSFLSSLQHVLAAAGSDEYVRQMFEHGQSVAFVPDRVCEIIIEILNDEREQFVQQLIKRTAAYEACFGAARAHKLEEIGTRLVDIASAQHEREAEHRSYIRMLRNQLAGAQSALLMKLSDRSNEFDTLTRIESHGHSLGSMASDVSQSIRSFQNVMRSTFGIAKAKARDAVNRYALAARNRIRQEELSALTAQVGRLGQTVELSEGSRERRSGRGASES